MDDQRGTPLPDRMKRYEATTQIALTPRMPLIVRVDGRCFHTLTRGFDKPWDARIEDAMTFAAVALCEEAAARFAYVQSDEISLLLTDYERLNTQAWFDKSLLKVVSVSASIATAAFNRALPERMAHFDARAFVVPKEEVANYFIWRQQDATRNSVSGLAQAHFSHKSLNGMSGPQMQERLFQERGINWNDLPVRHKRGWCVVRGVVDLSPPVFTQDRSYVERHLEAEPETVGAGAPSPEETP